MRSDYIQNIHRCLGYLLFGMAVLASS
ncbi:hypothetical protein GGR21_003660, partial [Dysgonomonas hofstadii]|nr:hypothetical protein [Dysgonomonas hofstadii]MBB4037739.1 hypothetical protein [Dysgonomonas hofstadii]